MPAVVWKGFISFGLVSFPVRLYSAARAEAVHFHLLHKTDLSRVKEVWYCAKENKPIERSAMVKGYETAAGRYVVVEDGELKKIAPPTATSMEVLQFVKADAVDPIWFERSYYVASDEKIAKPFALFGEALRQTQRCAIVKLSMHARENVALIRMAEDGLLLHTLYYADELHQTRKPALPKIKTSGQELSLAKQLIEQLSGEFKPEQFHDVYRENVEQLIEQKRKGLKVTSIEQPQKAKVVDLMEALRQSIQKSGAASKKPAKRRRVA